MGEVYYCDVSGIPEDPDCPCRDDHTSWCPYFEQPPIVKDISELKNLAPTFLRIKGVADTDPDPEWASEREIDEMPYEDLQTHIDQHVKFKSFIGPRVWEAPGHSPYKDGVLPIITMKNLPPSLYDNIAGDVVGTHEGEVRFKEAMGIKDSGARQKFATGAQRDVSEGKGYFHLVPYDGLEPVAKVFEAGARKYEKRNWEKGIPVENFINSGLRHLNKAASGWTDEPHLAMAAWNIICALATIARVEAGTLPDELAYNSNPE